MVVSLGSTWFFLQGVHGCSFREYMVESFREYICSFREYMVVSSGSAWLFLQGVHGCSFREYMVVPSGSK